MISLLVVKKYAEMLYIGLSWRFSPKVVLGYMSDINILDFHQKQLKLHVIDHYA